MFPSAAGLLPAQPSAAGPAQGQAQGQPPQSKVGRAGAHLLRVRLVPATGPQLCAPSAPDGSITGRWRPRKQLPTEDQDLSLVKKSRGEEHHQGGVADADGSPEMSRRWGWRSAFGIPGIPGAQGGRGQSRGESPWSCGRSAQGLSRGRSDLATNEGGVRSAPRCACLGLSGH